MNNEKIKEVLELKEQLADLMLVRLKRDPETSKNILLKTFEQILQSIDNPVAIEVFIEACGTGKCRTLVDIDQIKDFMVYVSRVFDEEDKLNQKLWDEFNDESVKLMKQRLKEIYYEKEYPEEKQEDVTQEEREKIFKIVNKLTDILKGDEDND